jgi:hypothetical protein
MDHKAILQTIDEEIDRLSKARALLTGNAAPTQKRSKMSAEGRVAAAQRARWAKARQPS